MRAVWVCVLVTTASPALADDDAPQVALAAEVGAVGGGGATPGGMRVGGRFLYRLAEHDWFDGGMAFTFGRGTAGCGAVGPDAMSCQHGVADGFAGDLSFGVRRDLGGQAGFVPFARISLCLIRRVVPLARAGGTPPGGPDAPYRALQPIARMMPGMTNGAMHRKPSTWPKRRSSRLTM